MTPPPDDETYESRAFRLSLETEMRRVAELVRDELPDGLGFALFLFPLGTKGNVAYMSNGRREDMIATIKDWLKHTEKANR